MKKLLGTWYIIVYASRQIMPPTSYVQYLCLAMYAVLPTWW